MEPRVAYTIEKPSFWRNRRELKDASHGKAGCFEMASVWSSKAEAEAHGTRYRFATPSVWDLRRGDMTDAAGQKIAHAEPRDWWGRTTLTFQGTSYVWKPATWHSGFTLLKDDREITKVRLGGYFKPGSISVSEGNPKELLPVILFGIYYYNLYANQAAAASGAGVYSS